MFTTFPWLEPAQKAHKNHIYLSSVIHVSTWSLYPIASPFCHFLHSWPPLSVTHTNGVTSFRYIHQVQAHFYGRNKDPTGTGNQHQTKIASMKGSLGGGLRPNLEQMKWLNNDEEEIYVWPVFTFQAWRSEGCELSSTCLATSLGSLFKAYKPEVSYVLCQQLECLYSKLWDFSLIFFNMSNSYHGYKSQ